jgi:hypothetical protein
VSFSDLSGLRWKCSSCDDWHSGPCLDFGFSQPFHWISSRDPATRWPSPLSASDPKPTATFLDPEYCSIDGESFFLRGVINLPIIGAAEFFHWGVWGSLSRQNFETLLKLDHDPKRADLPPMFSWLCSQISDYPNTLSLKMYAHIQEPGTRPHFRLERSNHPLSMEYFHGISPARVKEIMFRGLPAIDA